MAGAFLYDNLLLSAASLVGPAAIPSAPVANLLNPQPRVRMRSIGTNAAVLVDFGGPRPVDCVALVGTTVTTGAIVRVRLSSADITGAAGDVWDSGLLAASTGDEAGGNVVVVRSAGPVSGRYLLVELADGALTVVDVGVVAAGSLWRLTRAQSYGNEEGRVMGGTVDTNPLTQAQYTAPPLLNPRYTAFSVALMPSADANGPAREMRRRLGAMRDALWIPDLGLSQSELNIRSIWGLVHQPGEAGHIRAVFPGWTNAWRLVERV